MKSGWKARWLFGRFSRSLIGLLALAAQAVMGVAMLWALMAFPDTIRKEGMAVGLVSAGLAIIWGYPMLRGIPATWQFLRDTWM